MSDTRLKDHAKWLKAQDKGVRLDLSGEDLRSLDLSNKDLRYARLHGANLEGVDLARADLESADLSEANLTQALLENAKLMFVDLRGALLEKACLCGASLNGADLTGANLTGACLLHANLMGTDLSQVIGFKSGKEWIDKFDTCAEGVIVYKALGKTVYESPSSWVIKPGSYLTEVVNPERTLACGSGVNFGTKEYVLRMYPDATHWKCLIEWMDLVDVVVPYNTDGKARCARLKLLEKN